MTPEDIRKLADIVEENEINYRGDPQAAIVLRACADLMAGVEHSYGGDLSCECEVCRPLFRLQALEP